jgi:hypothetical protein
MALQTYVDAPEEQNAKRKTNLYYKKNYYNIGSGIHSYVCRYWE